ncbi:MAG: 30S ribosomal protein S9 [Candidatus Thermoplasmatota archaeon]|nr:30S ribosomal protein S9 [Candidatus Thermoplasmatota archaeon]MCL5888907.1 30S ribosomal protein S9 [Candidatus Thermoplasmatota archaeon]
MNDQTVITTGKRKTATARAYTKSGTGKFRINDYPVELYPVAILREKLMEPISLIGERSGTIDVDILVSGGGLTGQVDAARTAMAKGIVKFLKDNTIEEIYRQYDRTIMVNDIRRKLPKKPMGRGARAKRQKSYR